MKNLFYIFFFFQFSFLSTFEAKSQDGNKIILKDGKYGMTITMNKLTREVIKPQFDSIKPCYKNQVYIYKRKGKWGIFNAFAFKQEVYPITDSQFDEIIFLKELQHNEKGDYMGSIVYFLVKNEGKTALLNFPLNEASKKCNISPYFDEMGATAEEMQSNFKRLFYVKKDSLYGIYSARGIQKCPLEYAKHLKYADDKNNTFHVLSKNNENYLLVDNLNTNFPVVKADTIWFDQMIYWVNEKKDTLSYYEGGLKPIKK